MNMKDLILMLRQIEIESTKCECVDPSSCNARRLELILSLARAALAKAGAA